MFQGEISLILIHIKVCLAGFFRGALQDRHVTPDAHCNWSKDPTSRKRVYLSFPRRDGAVVGACQKALYAFP